LPTNADLNIVEVLFADSADMAFLKNLPACPKLQIVGIFIMSDVAVFPALELPSLHLLGLVAIERWTFIFFATSKADNPEWLKKISQSSMNFLKFF
jgi:hypothetical protein